MKTNSNTTTHNKNKEILISGAGIAGLTLAYWLEKDGHNVTVVEKDNLSRKGGYKVDIRGAALNITKKMGIYPLLLERNVNIQQSQFISSDLKVNSFDEDILGHSSEGDIEVNRWDLCQIIMNAIGEIKSIEGDTITQINKKTGLVSFDKASPKQFDIIIGADGTYSNVRSLVFGDHSAFLKESGLHFCVFPTENILNLSKTEVAYLEKGKLVAAYSVKDSSFVSFAFKGEEKRLIANDKKDVFYQQFKDVGWKANDLLAVMKSSEDCYFGSINQVRMDTWHQDSVVLVGDAAHAAHGIATSLAIVGAYVLARELRKSEGHIDRAFQAYEDSLRDFVENGQNLSESNYQILANSDSIFFKCQLYLLRTLPRTWIAWLTKKGKKKMREAANNIRLD